MTCVAIVDAYREEPIYEFLGAGATVVRVQSTVEVPKVYAGPLDLSQFAGSVVHAGDLVATAAAVSRYRPAAVVAGRESGVELADALADELGCAGNGTALSAARRDKHLMIETVRQAGLAAARQIRVDSAAALAKWHTDIGGRVVVKPIRSAGNDGVYFCDTVADSVAAFSAIDGAENVFSDINVGAVAQEYLHGAEYMVNTVSRDGCHRICETWSTTRITANGAPEYADAFHLMPRSGAVQDALASYAKLVLDALGIKHGPAHTEIRMTDRGPVLIECGARMAGDGLPYYVKIAQGNSQLDWTVRAYLDPARFLVTYADPCYPERLCSAVRLISPAAGTLRQYRNIAALHSLESFYCTQFRVHPGDSIAQTVDNVTCPAIVILMHRDEEVLRRDAFEIRRLGDAYFFDIEPT
ncbi:ATP-grasp domain-containing protein [Nocardia altamirensis]|uniref:ATP-grasp domain-containing protein n=1 Tax=Nocardia altamirensis TaxID=472158 RepID=UPI0008400768|nr:ATP-grasp domain-containing protein [Nocardia altamirensis]